MKILTHDEKYKADCLLKVDGVATQEYNNLTATDGAFCTWVPVQAGQKITVETGCTVHTRELQFDLVVDGIIRNVHKYQSKEWASKRHSVKFQTGFHMSGAVTEADLMVKDLEDEDYPTDRAEDQDTLGCIEVRMWVLQDEKQELHTQTTKGFDVCRNWRDLKDAPSYTTFQPTQEIDFIANVFNPPSAAKVTICKKRIASTRPGDKPWATFRFFYRTQESVNDEALMMTPKMKKKNLFRFTPPVAKLIGHDDEGEEQEETIFAPAGQDETGSDGGANSKETPGAVKAIVTRLADSADLDNPDLNSDKISGSQQADASGQARSVGTSAPLSDQVSNAPSIEIEANPVTKTTASKGRRTKVSTSIKARHKDAGVEDAKIIASEISTKATQEDAAPDLDSYGRAPSLSQDGIDAYKHELDDISVQLKELDDKPEEQWTSEEQEKYDNLLERRIQCKKTIASTAVQQDTEIMKRESTFGSVAEMSDEAKYDTIKGDVCTPHDSIAATPEYEETPVNDSLSRVGTIDALGTVMTSPETATIKSSGSIKRKTSMTPDHATKRLKEENDNRDKVIAEKRKILKDKQAAHFAARKKADDLEFKRKADLERIEAELDAKIAEMDDLRKQAQADYKESESLAAAASRDHSMDMD